MFKLNHLRIYPCNIQFLEAKWNRFDEKLLNICLKSINFSPLSWVHYLIFLTVWALNTGTKWIPPPLPTGIDLHSPNNRVCYMQNGWVWKFFQISIDHWSFKTFKSKRCSWWALGVNHDQDILCGPCKNKQTEFAILVLLVLWCSTQDDFHNKNANYHYHWLIEGLIGWLTQWLISVVQMKRFIVVLNQFTRSTLSVIKILAYSSCLCWLNLIE